MTTTYRIQEAVYYWYVTIQVLVLVIYDTEQTQSFIESYNNTKKLLIKKVPVNAALTLYNQKNVTRNKNGI